jgi:hypothetical protein
VGDIALSAEGVGPIPM